MTKTTRTFTVSIGDHETTVRISPAHLESEDAVACSGAFDGKVNVEQLALLRGIRKVFGARAFWWTDSGVKGFGQVMRSRKAYHEGADAVTMRVRATVAER